MVLPLPASPSLSAPGVVDIHILSDGGCVLLWSCSSGRVCVICLTVDVSFVVARVMVVFVAPDFALTVDVSL